METQKFSIEIDGIEKEASVVNVLNVRSKEILVYSVDNLDETSDLFYSEIIKDEEGYDKLVDIKDVTIKQEVMELINSMLS